MDLVYHSTRDTSLRYSASQAILSGIAPDGGLFVPSFMPAFPLPLAELTSLSYQDLAHIIFKEFLTDFTEQELRDCIHVYDDRFDTPVIAPVVTAGNVHYLELFHGPTIAFKDMALSILPKFMTVAANKNKSENDIVILTATSGDTGKAALVGFADVPHTQIIVFYPKNGVSEIQERQMVTQKGNNVHIIAIEGNFDDAQTKVKELFADQELRQELATHDLQFSSANSINIGRLLPQIVYYFYAYGQFVKDGKLQLGEPMNVTVPTGNFGNILAAYYAKEMGLPIGKLVVASNENNVLSDFFKTGTYNRNRDFLLTTSPSMDILVSSNLERLLYHLSGNRPEVVRSHMQSLSKEGMYEVAATMLEEAQMFHADFATESEVATQIRSVKEETGYVIDPHTAVAAVVADKYQQETRDQSEMVVVSTASPYKFPEAVVAAIDPTHTPESLLSSLHAVKKWSHIPFPPAIKEALDDPILHETVVPVAAMKQIVRQKLNIS